MEFIESENLFYEKPIHIKINKTYKAKTLCDFKSNKLIDNKKDYLEYLKSDKWAWYRSKILKRDGGKCTECDNAENLNVHHLTYRNLGHEQMKDLVTLCRDCHKKAHLCDLDKNAKASLIKELNDKYIIKK